MPKNSQNSLVKLKEYKERKYRIRHYSRLREPSATQTAPQLPCAPSRPNTEQAMDSPRNFHDDLRRSKLPGRIALARNILERLVPGSSVAETDEQADRLGADFWLIAHAKYGVDFKFRERDCRRFNQDDLCIELSSSTGAVGWGLEPGPLSNLVVWVWLDSGRFYACGSLDLACVTRAKLSEWQKYAKTTSTATKTGSYSTTCTFVPMREFEQALTLWRRGEL